MACCLFSTKPLPIPMLTYNVVTHWGRETHICVGEHANIGSDNGLSPNRRQAIIWTNAGILLIGPLGTNFNEILIAIHTFSFKKMHLKMSSGKWRPFCLGLNVLRCCWSSSLVCWCEWRWPVWQVLSALSTFARESFPGQGADILEMPRIQENYFLYDGSQGNHEIEGYLHRIQHKSMFHYDLIFPNFNVTRRSGKSIYLTKTVKNWCLIPYIL